MHEKIFSNLIVKHRKGMLIFERVADKDQLEYYAPYIQWGYGKETIRGEPIPHYTRKELDWGWSPSKEEAEALYSYLLAIGPVCWKTFEPKEPTSMAAEYDSYWDRDYKDEGNIYLNYRGNLIWFSPPYQQISEENCRLCRFTPKKIETFVYYLGQAIATYS